MEYIVGLVLAAGVAVFARLIKFDRDRSFYPVVLIVVASYYVLFAVMGGSVQALIIELLIMACFVVAAVVGMKRHLWLVAAGLVAHGIMDSFHVHLVTNPGMPEWWPGFCMAYDVLAGCLMFMTQNEVRYIPGVQSLRKTDATARSAR
jgi:hypothetical protein